jgi:hypothetical protein
MSANLRARDHTADAHASADARGRGGSFRGAGVSGSLLFREVNERIRELEGHGSVGEYDFVCECADDACTSVIRLTAEQYEAVRSDASAFAVLPGHERADTDVVLGRRDGYVTIAKRYSAAEAISTPAGAGAS